MHTTVFRYLSTASAYVDYFYGSVTKPEQNEKCRGQPGCSPISNFLKPGNVPSGPGFLVLVTLRIAKEDLETARRLAARKGLGYQTYIKMVLREALAERAAEK